MAKELTEEQKLRRKERAAARRAKKKEEKAAEEAKKAARKKHAEERRRQKKAEFDRTEQRLKKTYIGKNIDNTDLELINYPFYTTSYNHEVKVDVGADDIIKAVKLTRM